MKRKKGSVKKDNEGIISYDEWYIRSKLDASDDGETMSECTTYDDLYDEYLKKIYDSMYWSFLSFRNSVYFS